MRSNDGLVVPVRPFAGRLSADALMELANLAERYGNRELRLTNRGAVQLRGISETDWPPVIEALVGLGLVAASPDAQGPRLLVTPFSRPADSSWSIATRLRDRIAGVGGLPPKFTFVVDAGPRRDLAGVPAQVRIEASNRGGFVVRAAGHPMGRHVAQLDAPAVAIELSQWFARCGAESLREMMNAAARDLPAQWTGSLPAPLNEPPQPGKHPRGFLVGAPFGVLTAQAVRLALGRGTIDAVRVTPWRSLLLEGAGEGTFEGFVDRPDDPRIGVDACSGAPFCPQATVETRELAQVLATRLRLRGRGPSLHISGCAKGCARAAPADLVWVGRDGRFDFIHDGRADDRPQRRDLTSSEVLEHAETIDALRV